MDSVALTSQKTLVLCVAEVTRKWGPPHQDSVMLEVDTAEEIIPLFSQHFADLKAVDPYIVRWEMTMYLPQRPLKRGRILH